MHRLKLLGTAVAAAAAVLAASAGYAWASPSARALFVQNDRQAGNQIIAYDRAADGTLAQAGVYATGGLGGALEGSVVDHLASQGSLSYDRRDQLLYAVNAGSNSISVFAVFGDRLALRQVLPSGGSFPVSIAVHDSLLYVLNATQGGALAGFRVSFGRLVPIAGATRALGLDPSATPQFVNTPGQVLFSPDGSQLIVTTKANGDAVEVFGVDRAGHLSAAATVTALPGAVPFAGAFDHHGNLLLTEAGPNALASFALAPDGTLAQLDAVATEQQATCWIVGNRERFYTSNAGSSSLSDIREEAQGNLLARFATTATDAGTVDATIAPGGRYLYVQAGAAGIVDEYAIGAGGALTEIGSVSVPEAIGGEGIVAP